MERDNSSRGNAGQFFVAGELCRRGYAAVVTLGNTPNTDVLCSNREGTKFVHIQVKTFLPGTKTCSVGLKAERPIGPSFYWVLAGIPSPMSPAPFEYFIISALIWPAMSLRFTIAGLRHPARTGANIKTVRFVRSTCRRTLTLISGALMRIVISGTSSSSSLPVNPSLHSTCSSRFRRLSPAGELQR